MTCISLEGRGALILPIIDDVNRNFAIESIVKLCKEEETVITLYYEQIIESRFADLTDVSKNYFIQNGTTFEYVKAPLQCDTTIEKIQQAFKKGLNGKKLNIEWIHWVDDRSYDSSNPIWYCAGCKISLVKGSEAKSK